jgi:hypothetical protein
LFLDMAIFSLYRGSVKYVEKGLLILQQAETALRSAASEAATAGDYEGTVTLALWGQKLADLAAPAIAAPTTTGQTAQMPPEGIRAAIPVVERAGPPEASARRAGTRRRADEYPRFLRRMDQLIKVGWSKRKKAEYQHKAPRQVLDAVVGLLGAASAQRERVAIPDLLPLRAADDGAELPPYQVYVCLAWLRTIGLIEQHGREGYTVPRPDTLPKDAAAAWEALEGKRPT